MSTHRETRREPLIDTLSAALLLNTSPRTLERLFVLETGMPFARWRQALRLAEAAARLASGEAPARVGAAVGYASGPAFGAAFRAAFGITPGAVRSG